MFKLQSDAEIKRNTIMEQAKLRTDNSIDLASFLMSNLSSLNEYKPDGWGESYNKKWDTKTTMDGEV